MRAIACNLTAIGAEQRPRYHDLVRCLRAAIVDRSELVDGYAYRLKPDVLTLPEVAEWITLERLCCPFLTLQLAAAGNQPDWLLSLTGPLGVKDLLQLEFPAPRLTA